MPEIKEGYWKIVSSKYDGTVSLRTHADVTSGTILVRDPASKWTVVFSMQKMGYNRWGYIIRVFSSFLTDFKELS